MKNLIEKTKSLFIKKNRPVSSSSSKGLSIQERAQNFFYSLKNPHSNFQSKTKPFALFFVLLMCAYFMSHFIIIGLEKFIGEPKTSSSKSPTSLNLPEQKRIDHYSVITIKNLFNADLEDESSNTPNAIGAPVKSSLPFDLIGTLIFQDSSKSIGTLIERNSKRTYPIRVNEEIPGQIRVREVLPNRIIFVNLQQNKNEYIELPESSFTKKQTVTRAAPTTGAGIERVAGNKFQIARSELESNLANMNQILTQARALPDPEGFRLIQIQAGSIYEKLGLNNGDIITMINGEPLRDPLKAMEYFQQIKDMPGLDLSVKRNGQIMNFNYEIN